VLHLKNLLEDSALENLLEDSALENLLVKLPEH
jgi:hypothetical protein